MTSPLAHPSYHTTNDRYLKGPSDIPFILTSLICFIVLREVLMRYLLAPIAHRWVVHRDLPPGLGPDCKIPTNHSVRLRKAGEREMRTRRKEAVRFAEQGWSVLYYLVYWSFGLVSPSLGFPFQWGKD